MGAFTIERVLAKPTGRGEPPNLRLAAVESGSTTTDASSLLEASISPTVQEPFGLSTFRAPQGLLWVKWRQLQGQIRHELPILAACRTEPDSCSSSGAQKLLAIIADAKKRSGRARIEVVNRLVNVSVRYMSDYAQHGVADLWSPPLATLSSARGDCEDYAIAKYVALHEAGILEADLRLLLVRDRPVGQDHAVLAVRLDDRWLVLDNRHMMLTDSADLPQFTPLFALSYSGVKMFAARPM
jgi:predicted transglutaminase-like cysteine proteinase